MRNRLEWMPQDDAHSCGPLSTAAATLVMEGIRPTASLLRNGSKDKGMDTGVELRKRLLLIWMTAATESGSK